MPLLASEPVPFAVFIARIRYKLLRLATARTSENFVGLLRPTIARPRPCNAPYSSG